MPHEKTTKMPAPELLLNDTQAAARLGVTAGTMRVWRCTGRYPLPYVRLGRTIRYRPADIDAYISARVVTPAAVV